MTLLWLCISNKLRGSWSYHDAVICTVFYALIKFSLLCWNTSAMTRHCKNLSLKVANWYTKVNLLWRPIIELIKLNFTMWIIKVITHMQRLFYCLIGICKHLLSTFTLASFMTMVITLIRDPDVQLRFLLSEFVIFLFVRFAV